MVIKKILFPAPNPPHYSETSHEENLLWIPAGPNPTKMPPIPCFLYSPFTTAKFLMIWCHGNACDLGSTSIALRVLSDELNIHILAFEYPSYGLCKEPIEPGRETINSYADRTYSFVRDTLRWPSDRILLFGHSIGSGPACHLASTQEIGGLILQSAYTSIYNVAKEKVGILSLAVAWSYWDNLTATKNIRCPVLLIHGEEDDIIPAHHSQTLSQALAHIENKKLILLSDHDHNSIPYGIVVQNVGKFIQDLAPATPVPTYPLAINPELRAIPTNEGNTSETSLSCFLSSCSGFFSASTNATRSAFSSISSLGSKNSENQNK